MCGISGICSVEIIPNLDERIDRMNTSIAHRGPDFGAYSIYNKNVAIGHRRLSIIDLRKVANQPMHSHDGKWHIVFNGEIYNFKEIATRLTYSFVTSSDTEVILAAVQEKSLEWFLEIANGMFSIALFNSETKDLFLVRDRLGIKPLYYYKDSQNIVFSSEIKGILSSGLVTAKFNELAIDEYLANRYIRSPYTFFTNIFQVPSGSYLTIKSDLSVFENEYWTLPKTFNMAQDFNEEGIAERFEEEVVKAVKYRLITDVPLGTYLSGGVDSSLITAITALTKKEPINTYTIGFQALNEFKYARQIADKYQTVHHEMLMQKSDYLNHWESLISFKDAPLGVPNEIPLAVMSTKLKEKITVVISGEGADELMGGYGRIFRTPFDFKNNKVDQSFYSYFINKYEYVSRELRDQLITSPITYRKEFDAQIASDFEKASNEENVFRFFHKYHVKGLLQRVDMTTMQTSVEARVPFLDHKLIEFTYNEIPFDLKLKWINKKSRSIAKGQFAASYSEALDIPKYLLRKISYNYLPEETITRKKVGFPVPLTEWFEILEEMAKETLAGCTWLKEGALERLISKSRTATKGGQLLWMFLNIELFRKQYFQKEWRW